MALDNISMSKLAFILSVAALSMPSVWSCPSFYEQAITDFCHTQFTLDMAELDKSLWCSWDDTLQPYGELTNCTFMIALKLDCFWPNQVVDRFFINIHQKYFHDCALIGRLIHDPPISILGPFVAVPVLVTLLVTALVVWRSKRSEGVL